MPHGLAIETSGRLGSIALTDNGAIVSEDSFAHGLKHAAEMVPRIDALLNAAGWPVADIREIYVSVGPGSFTGVRIGITLAKTLAFATGAKIAAVPSVEALARNAPPEACDILIVLDAKRDQIFTARLRRESVIAPWQVIEPAHLDTLAAMLARAPRPIYLIGEGIPYHEKFLPSDDQSVIVTSEASWRARADAVAEIGFGLARRQMFTDLDSLSPIYIRKPEAEEKFEAAAAEKRP